MAYTKTTWVNGGAPALSAENLNKIEQGIVDAQTITGTYSGDGTASRNINLGFRPKCVLLIRVNSDGYYDHDIGYSGSQSIFSYYSYNTSTGGKRYLTGGLFFGGEDISRSASGLSIADVVTFSPTGFSVKQTTAGTSSNQYSELIGALLNLSGYVYKYIAWR